MAIAEAARIEHGIIFSAEMVRAILEGRKTQTRRICKFRITGPNPPNQSTFDMYDANKWIGAFVIGRMGSSGSSAALNCPYGVRGDRLWVRETLHRSEDGEWHYSADCKVVTVPTADTEKVTALRVWAHHKESPHCPSIHMPRWASRLTLEIVNVRVERVQEISDIDAFEEGMQTGVPRAQFMELWNSINKKRGFGWDRNPWVWVIKFRRLM